MGVSSGPSVYSSTCFSDEYTYEACCDLRHGVRGNDSCWSDLGASKDGWRSIVSGEAFAALDHSSRYHYTRCCLDRIADLFVPCLYCSWAEHHSCLHQRLPRSIGGATGVWADASVSAALPEYCLALCCGPSIIPAAAPPRQQWQKRTTGQGSSFVVPHPASPPGVDTRDQAEKDDKDDDLPLPGHPQATTRQCHLHTTSALYCEYENLCLAPADSALAVVFLRGSQYRQPSSSSEKMWLPLHTWPARDVQDAFWEQSIAPYASSLVLPVGFFWPPLIANLSHELLSHRSQRTVVGWSQPAEEVIDSHYTHWLPSGSIPGKGPLAAVLIGLDPYASPGNIFHFAQIVLPAFAARVRLARGRQGGAGLLNSMPSLSPVILHDPGGVLRHRGSRWQRGLLDLVVGRDTEIMWSDFHTSAPKAATRWCFRRAVVVGRSSSDRAVTGRVDHVALLSEATRRLGVAFSPRDVVLHLRGPPDSGPGVRGLAGRRHLRDGGKVLAAMRDAIHQFVGPQPSGDPRGRNGPRVRVHGWLGEMVRGAGAAGSQTNSSFLSQVQLFSRCALLVGTTGAGMMNLIFMPPSGVVLVLQPRGVAEFYAAVAAGVGHYPIVHFVSCAEDPQHETEHSGLSARLCGQIVPCKNRAAYRCQVDVDIPAFLNVFRDALSFAFVAQLGGVAHSFPAGT